MAAAAFITRVAGPLLMSHVNATPRIERFLEGLSVSVITALVGSQLMTAELNNISAVVVATIAMLTTGSVIGAMLVGMIAAAAFPFIVPVQ